MAHKSFENYAFVEGNSLEINFDCSSGNSAKAKTPGQMFKSSIDMTLYAFKENKLDINVKSDGVLLGSRYVSGEILPFPHYPNNFGATYPVNTTSTLVEKNGYIADFGFYNADAAVGGLTDKIQTYAYCSSSKAQWMTDLVAEVPGAGQKPFSRFVLPGAHDAGMNNARHLAEIIGTLAPAIIFMPVLKLILAIGAAASVPIASAFAMTQRHSATDMLKMGTRYFDFRPAYDFGTFSGELYHQHMVIPGSKFSDFLLETVKFLDENPGELSVISLSFDGIAQDEMKPSVSVLQDAIAEALAKSSTGLNTANASDLNTSYDDLVATNKRLFFLNKGVGFDEAANSNSYSDSAYSTFDPNSVLNAIKAVPKTPPSGSVYTVLQTQGTPTALWSDYATAIPRMAITPWTSPLLATKAKFDHVMYPWIQSNAASFDINAPLVLLNDFVEPALSSIAMQATKQRLEAS